MLQSNSQLFQDNTEPTPFAEYSINLTEDTLTAVPPYRLSVRKKEVLKTQIEKLLFSGIIEECESPYAAPVVLIPKKDRTLRLTVDYKKLNSKTVPDKYSFPRLDDVLHAAQKTHFMTTLDLKPGFHQMSVKLTVIKLRLSAHLEYLDTRECHSDFAISHQLSRGLWTDLELDYKASVC